MSLFEIFITFFKINAFTFGGGYSIVPMILDEFSHKRGLITEDEMLDIIAIAQSGPGVMAISTSLLTGYKVKGVTGAIIAVIASILPCIIVIGIVAQFYDAFRTNIYINGILDGISGAICAILLATTIKMGYKNIKEYPIFSSIIIIGVLILRFIFKMDSAKLIFISGILSIFYLLSLEKKGDKNAI